MPSPIPPVYWLLAIGYARSAKAARTLIRAALFFLREEIESRVERATLTLEIKPPLTNRVGASRFTGLLGLR